ncbi:MAG: hypothetical protein ACYC5G_00045 [Candidatus Doudnabacteria bacterium]
MGYTAFSIKFKKMESQNILSARVLLRKSWHTYKTKFAVLFGILSAPLVVMVLSYLFSEMLPPLSFVLLILAGLLGWASQIAMIYALKTQDLGVLEAYKLGISKLLSVLWIGILVAGNLISALAIPFIFGVIVLSMQQAGMFESSKSLLWTLSGIGILLAVLGIILAIYLSILYQFGTYALVVDERRGVDALSLSSALVKGRWMTVFSKLLVVIVIFTLPVIILGLFMQNQQSLYSLVQSVFGYLIAPFVVAFMYHLFVGLKEGKDVSVDDTDQKNWIVGRSLFGFATILALFLFLIVIQKTTYFPGLKDKLEVLKVQTSSSTK